MFLSLKISTDNGYLASGVILNADRRGDRSEESREYSLGLHSRHPLGFSSVAPQNDSADRFHFSIAKGRHGWYL